jgi:hypothetical protein
MRSVSLSSLFDEQCRKLDNIAPGVCLDGWLIGNIICLCSFDVVPGQNRPSTPLSTGFETLWPVIHRNWPYTLLGPYRWSAHTSKTATLWASRQRNHSKSELAAEILLFVSFLHPESIVHSCYTIFPHMLPLLLRYIITVSHNVTPKSCYMFSFCWFYHARYRDGTLKEDIIMSVYIHFNSSYNSLTILHHKTVYLEISG